MREGGVSRGRKGGGRAGEVEQGERPKEATGRVCETEGSLPSKYALMHSRLLPYTTGRKGEGSSVFACF